MEKYQTLMIITKKIIYKGDFKDQNDVHDQDKADNI